MSSIEYDKSHNVRLYACGGAGCSIAKKLKNFSNDTESFSSVDIAFIDTSKSDLHGVDPNQIYTFEDRDGSGGLRRENSAVISKHAQDILQKFRPAKLNIILSSASGGSGNIIAATLTNQLLGRDELVIVILVGAVDTKLYIENTLNTLKTFEAISQKHSKSLVMKYSQNQSTSKRGDTDLDVSILISALSLLFSGNNKSLDSKDLYHWINFNKVTTFKPQLSSLNFVNNTSINSVDGEVISVVTLGNEDSNVDYPEVIEVQYTGFIPESTDELTKEQMPIHFIITDGLFARLGKELNTSLEELNRISESRVTRDLLITDNDAPNEDGIIL